MKTYLICFSLLIALPRFIPAATFNIADGDVAALKAAIATANTNNQTNTINLATNGSYILNGADDGINGLPVIQGTANNFPLTVNGNGSVIIRNPALGTSSFRIMKIDCPTGTSVQVYLDHLTLVNGSIAGSVESGFGGGIFANGAGASLTLTSCTLNAHHGAVGAAICSSGPLNVSDSFIHDNIASDQGGGIYNGGTLTLNGCRLVTNQADTGGAIYTTGMLTMDHSQITGSISLHDGGGIYFDTYSSNAVGRIRNCTFNNNSASGYGGAIWYQGPGTGDDLSITGLFVSNSTISGNTASAGGGALAGYLAGIVRLEHSTITQNSAPDGAGIFVAGEETPNNQDAFIVFLFSTILDGNLGDDFVFSYSFSQHLPTPLRSNDYNLIGVVGQQVVFLFEPSAHDQIGVIDPRLAPLADNGGPTLTHRLLFASPAVDAGNGGSYFETGPTTDQRGNPRTYDLTDVPNAGDATDIGALEVEQPFGESLIVTTTVDEDDLTSNPAFGTGTSLREAVNYVNAIYDDQVYSITFALPHGSVLQLNSELLIYGRVHIDACQDPSAITIKRATGAGLLF